MTPTVAGAVGIEFKTKPAESFHDAFISKFVHFLLQKIPSKYSTAGFWSLYSQMSTNSVPSTDLIAPLQS